MAALSNTSVGYFPSHFFPRPELMTFQASAPSLQMAVNLLSDLAETTQEVSNQYEVTLDRMQDGSDLEEEDVEVSLSQALILLALTSQQKLRNEFIGDAPLSDDLIRVAFVARSQMLFSASSYTAIYG